MTTNRQPNAQWRVEFNACGWASRYWVVRGFREIGPVDVAGDYVDESDAIEAANKMNVLQHGEKQ